MSYDLILADPPWRYDFAATNSRKIENQYPTMSVDAISALQVPARANCVLYLWATAPKLREALAVMYAWDFEYKTHGIWMKDRLGMGYWWRNQHELLLVGVRGKVSPPVPSLRTSSLMQGIHAEHSKKPESVYEMIERQHREKTKVELFARNIRDGWAHWGNELPNTAMMSCGHHADTITHDTLAPFCSECHNVETMIEGET
jgi:N6-adenosine-specific RNA methylase IME4